MSCLAGTRRRMRCFTGCHVWTEDILPLLWPWIRFFSLSWRPPSILAVSRPKITTTCTRLSVINCFHVRHWLKPWGFETSSIFIDIPCRNLNDVNKENGLHQNTNISKFGIFIHENGKSDLQNSFWYGNLKDTCIQEKYFKCKNPLVDFTWNPLPLAKSVFNFQQLTKWSLLF